MNDEYIRLDAAIIAIDHLINEAATGTMARTLFKAKDTLYNQQRYVIDVQPVKRGKWIWSGSPEFGNPYGSYICSECESRQAYRENFCPDCGARMDGEQNDYNDK